jgi:hypothetical protein
MSLGEQKEPIHVNIVNPPIQDPWRTQGDYRDDQRRAQSLHRVAVASVIVAAFSGAAASVAAVAALRPSTPQPVTVECVAPPATLKPTQK